MTRILASTPVWVGRTTTSGSECVAPELTPYRLDRLENRVDKLDAKTDDLGIIRDQLHDLRGDVAKLIEKADANQRALLTTALSVTASAIIIALSIFLVLK
jgi:hypothetical protein